MTRKQYTQKIERELRKLNERIDYKILRGETYREESLRHRALLARIRKQKKGLLARLFPVSIFGI